MSFASRGIHHVTAIAGNAQRNLDFYSGILGLRLVKRTVNYDDPTTYHLYYGDYTGSPGSLLTFFPWTNARRGRQGAGQVAVTSFAILPGSVGFWIDRLLRFSVEFERPTTRFDNERVIAFKDGDGFLGELVAHPSVEEREGWEGQIPREHAIRGLYSATLWLESCDLTGKVLTEDMGFRPVREQASIFRYSAGDGGPGTILDLRCVPGLWQGALGAGINHHIAFRAPDNEEQVIARTRLVKRGLNVTPPIDRRYFHSIYFREPGGVLFEIATDPPGFTIDEPIEALGHALQLPDWLEQRRFEIEALLPNIRVPFEMQGPNA